MDPTLEALFSVLPELAKLGGWGALLALLITRVLVTRKEKDEAVAAERERVADKEQQIVVLTKSLKDGDAAMERLAVAWEAAIGLIIRQRGDK